MHDRKKSNSRRKKINPLHLKVDAAGVVLAVVGNRRLTNSRRIESAMNRPQLFGLGISTLSSLMITPAAIADGPLFLAYPPLEHQTSSDRIFLIGTGDPNQPVLVNGAPIAYRSPAGHFAPTLPLALGENTLTLTQGDDSITVNVTRVPGLPVVSPELGYVVESLTPQVTMTRPAGELVCFGAIALPDAGIAVTWGGDTIDLAPVGEAVTLPPNSAVLTSDNQPIALTATAYEGCTVMPATGPGGPPTYTLAINGDVITQTLPVTISRQPLMPFSVATVIAEAGVAFALAAFALAAFALAAFALATFALAVVSGAVTIFVNDILLSSSSIFVVVIFVFIAVLAFLLAIFAVAAFALATFALAAFALAAFALAVFTLAVISGAVTIFINDILLSSSSIFVAIIFVVIFLVAFFLVAFFRAAVLVLVLLS